MLLKYIFQDKYACNAAFHLVYQITPNVGCIIKRKIKINTYKMRY